MVSSPSIAIARRRMRRLPWGLVREQAQDMKCDTRDRFGLTDEMRENIRAAQKIIENGKIREKERKETKRNCEIRRRLNAARDCMHKRIGDASACPDCGVPVDTLYMLAMLDQFHE